MPDIQTAFKSALTKTLQEWDDDGENLPHSSRQPVSSSSQPPQPSQNIQGIPMTKSFNITNNVSRATFNYVRDNPGSTRKEIMTALSHQGYGQGSVSSLIAQMVRNKMAHVTNNLYYADIPEYTPIKSLKAIKKLEAPPKRKYEKKDKTGITGIGALLREKLEAAPDRAAPHADTEIEAPKRVITLTRRKSPEDIVNNMTVYEARELYVHLKQLFGG
jgi:hypothetical protein